MELYDTRVEDNNRMKDGTIYGVKTKVQWGLDNDFIVFKKNKK